MKKRVIQPVYLQIADDLRTRIQAEDWGPGHMLPSRSDLAREYGVALMTIQKAIQPLLDKGLLVASHRRGTFVAEKIHSVFDPPPNGDAVRDGAGVDIAPVMAAPVMGIIGNFHIDMSDYANWENLDSWTSRVMRGLNAQFDELGGSTEIFNLYDKPQGEDGPITEVLDQAIASGVQCLAFFDIHAQEGYSKRIPRLMQGRDLPYVIVSGSSLTDNPPRVCIDEAQAGRVAAAHLLEVGYRNILFMPLYDFRWERLRLEGAQQQAGAALVLPGEADIELLRPAYEQLHVSAQPERATLHAEIIDRVVNFDALVPGDWAVLMPNDPTAVPLHGVLQQLGIKPGRDLGLIGFDDHSYASLLGISSVGQPLHQIGLTASRLLYEAVLSGLEDVQAIVRSRVVSRASTQRHPRRAHRP